MLLERDNEAYEVLLRHYPCTYTGLAKILTKDLGRPFSKGAVAGMIYKARRRGLITKPIDENKVHPGYKRRAAAIRYDDAPVLAPITLPRIPPSRT